MSLENEYPYSQRPSNWGSEPVFRRSTGLKSAAGRLALISSCQRFHRQLQKWFQKYFAQKSTYDQTQ